MSSRPKEERREIRDRIRASERGKMRTAEKNKAEKKFLDKIQAMKVEITGLKERLAAIRGSPPIKPTRETMVERREGKGNPVRDSVWERRSRQLRTAGFAIHGDLEGFLCDVMYHATANNKRIDTLLRLPKVAERSGRVELYRYLFCCHCIDILNEIIMHTHPRLLKYRRVITKVREENKKAAREPDRKIGRAHV